jgi:hypothetical protein
LNPVVLFFVLGLFAGLVGSGLKLPPPLYKSLSIYLLLAIGLKGGIELSNADVAEAALPALVTLLLGLVIPCLAYFILRRTGRFARPDSAAIAAHYGSTSAVTYAVCLGHLQRAAIFYEHFTTLLLVILEIPAIVVGILIAKVRAEDARPSWGSLFHEILLAKAFSCCWAASSLDAWRALSVWNHSTGSFSTCFQGRLPSFFWKWAC